MILPCQSFVEVQDWSEKAQREKGDYMVEVYMTSLPEEIYIDLTHNSLAELVIIWGQTSEPNKRNFYEKYGQKASLIPIKVEDSLVRATIQL